MVGFGDHDDRCVVSGKLPPNIFHFERAKLAEFGAQISRGLAKGLKLFSDGCPDGLVQ